MDTPSDEGNISIMVDLQLLGHSKRSISTSHCNMKQKSRTLTLLSSAFAPGNPAIR